MAVATTATASTVRSAATTVKVAVLRGAIGLLKSANRDIQAFTAAEVQSLCPSFVAAVWNVERFARELRRMECRRTTVRDFEGKTSALAKAEEILDEHLADVKTVGAAEEYAADCAV